MALNRVKIDSTMCFRKILLVSFTQNKKVFSLIPKMQRKIIYFYIRRAFFKKVLILRFSISFLNQSFDSFTFLHHKLHYKKLFFFQVEMNVIHFLYYAEFIFSMLVRLLVYYWYANEIIVQVNINNDKKNTSTLFKFNKIYLKKILP